MAGGSPGPGKVGEVIRAEGDVDADGFDEAEGAEGGSVDGVADVAGVSTGVVLEGEDISLIESNAWGAPPVEGGGEVS